MGNEHGKPGQLGQPMSRQGSASGKPGPVDVARKFSKPLSYNMKLVIRGDRAVGKSALYQRLQGGPFIEKHEATPEIQVAHIYWSYKVTDDVVKIEVWDVVDQARPKQTGLKLENDATPELRLDASFVDVYRGAHGAILVLDISKRWTFDYVQREAEKIPRDIPILVLGNMRDKEGERKVDADEVTAWAESLERPFVRYAEASMLNMFGLRYIHRFLNVPFLNLQREALMRQVETNAREMKATLEELVLVAGVEQDYALFVENLEKARSDAAGEGSQTGSQTSKASIVDSPRQQSGQATPRPESPQLAQKGGSVAKGPVAPATNDKAPTVQAATPAARQPPQAQAQPPPKSQPPPQPVVEKAAEKQKPSEPAPTPAPAPQPESKSSSGGFFKRFSFRSKPAETKKPEPAAEARNPVVKKQNVQTGPLKDANDFEPDEELDDSFWDGPARPERAVPGMLASEDDDDGANPMVAGDEDLDSPDEPTPPPARKVEVAAPKRDEKKERERENEKEMDADKALRAQGKDAKAVPAVAAAVASAPVGAPSTKGVAPAAAVIPAKATAVVVDVKKGAAQPPSVQTAPVVVAAESTKGKKAKKKKGDSDSDASSSGSDLWEMAASAKVKLARRLSDASDAGGNPLVNDDLDDFYGDAPKQAAKPTTKVAKVEEEENDDVMPVTSSKKKEKKEKRDKSGREVDAEAKRAKKDKKRSKDGGGERKKEKRRDRERDAEGEDAQPAVVEERRERREEKEGRDTREKKEKKERRGDDKDARDKKEKKEKSRRADDERLETTQSLAPPSLVLVGLDSPRPTRAAPSRPAATSNVASELDFLADVFSAQSQPVAPEEDNADEGADNGDGDHSTTPPAVVEPLAPVAVPATGAVADVKRSDSLPAHVVSPPPVAPKAAASKESEESGDEDEDHRRASGRVPAKADSGSESDDGGQAFANPLVLADNNPDWLDSSSEEDAPPPAAKVQPQSVAVKAPSSSSSPVPVRAASTVAQKQTATPVVASVSPAPQRKAAPIVAPAPVAQKPAKSRVAAADSDDEDGLNPLVAADEAPDWLSSDDDDAPMLAKKAPPARKPVSDESSEDEGPAQNVDFDAITAAISAAVASGKRPLPVAAAPAVAAVSQPSRSTGGAIFGGASKGYDSRDLSEDMEDDDDADGGGYSGFGAAYEDGGGEAVGGYMPGATGDYEGFGSGNNISAAGRKEKKEKKPKKERKEKKEKKRSKRHTDE